MSQEPPGARTAKDSSQFIPVLVIVTGLPCTGKTTVARQLANELGFPLVTKDDIKERLFDALGWRDREWSRKLGGATYEILFYFIDTLLAVGNSLIAESNFPPQWTAQRLRDIQELHPFRAAVVECIARAEVVEQRWRRRAELSLRHPGHGDAEALDEFLEAVHAHTTPDGFARLGPPPVGAPSWEVDTSRQSNLTEVVGALRGLGLSY